MQAVRGDEENFLRETKVIEPNECVRKQLFFVP